MSGAAILRVRAGDDFGPLAVPRDSFHFSGGRLMVAHPVTADECLKLLMGAPHLAYQFHRREAFTLVTAVPSAGWEANDSLHFPEWGDGAPMRLRHLPSTLAFSTLRPHLDRLVLLDGATLLGILAELRAACPIQVESNPNPKPIRGRPRRRPALVAIRGGGA